MIREFGAMVLMVVASLAVLTSVAPKPNKSRVCARAPKYLLQRLLHSVAADVDMVVFSNHESAIECEDIEEPFSEVTMFKKNYVHITKETYFGLYEEATWDNSNYFLTYGNGKVAAYIEDNLQSNGAHM